MSETQAGARSMGGSLAHGCPSDADHDREEHQGQERQGPRRRFGRAPDYHAPRTTGEILQHQPRHRSQRDPEKEDIGPEVGPVELKRPGKEEADGAEHSPCAPRSASRPSASS